MAREHARITTSLEMAGIDGGRVGLTREQVDALRSRVTGPLLRPGDERWPEAVRIWNGMAATMPALVLQPATPLDVAAAVRFARDQGLLLSIKGGGHNIAGTAAVERGLMLDMSQMREVRIDPRARLGIVGAGCRLKDVDQATQEHGLATVLGFISEVGVAGLTLGGGLGYLTRRFGWTVDNLEEVQIVTADGEIRVANRSQNADLFWALRGGGGNFGVVTRFTFRLHAVGPTVYGGLIAWPFERADEILDAYRTITTHASRELALWLVLLNAPPAPFVPEAWHHKRLCGMCVCYTGVPGKADDALAPIRALAGPVVDLLQAQPYTQVQSYLDGTEPNGLHYYWKTEYLPELSDRVLSTLRDLFAECPIPGGDLGVLHLEGALNSREADDGAVGNRDARFVVGVKGMWDAGEPNAEAYRRWVGEAGQRLRPFSTGATYINFQTADEDEGRVRATYGPNLQRLVEIKKTYDPANVFRVNRNIRPE